jgi:competence protein ComFC
MKGLNKIADFFYPMLKCPICLTFNEGLCIDCRASFKSYDKGSLDQEEKGVSIYIHQEAVKTLVSNFKKKIIYSAGDTMIMLFLENSSIEIENFDFITYAPSSLSSVKKLGFDHGAYLAKGIGRELKIPVVGLFKPSDKEQKVLERDERVENAKKISFSGNKISGLKGKRGLVIDDVFTTGSTVFHCLELMKREGVAGKYITFSRIL